MRTLALSLAFFCGSANADWISEFGVGYKLETTSVVLKPGCTFVDLHGPVVEEPSSEHYGKKTGSCGGDNPLFIGWPLAFEHTFSGPWAVRIGWFHMSHWGDGGGKFAELLGSGDNRETHLDCLCMVAKYNWSRR